MMTTTTEESISMSKDSEERRARREFEATVDRITKQQAAEGAIVLDSGLKVRARPIANLHPRKLKIDDNPVADPDIFAPREIAIRYQTFYYFRSKGTKVPRKESEYYSINAPFYDVNHCRFGSYEDLLARGGEWAKWLVTYTNLTPRLFEIAKENECASFSLAVNWDKLADAQGSDIFTFNGLVRQMAKEETEKKKETEKSQGKDKDKDKEEEE